MHEKLKALWQIFRNWVYGVGPRPENEPPLPDIPPDQPFTRYNNSRRSRFHELTIRERWDAWANRRWPNLFDRLYRIMSVATCLLLLTALLTAVADFPPFGAADNPVNNEVVARYLERGYIETGAQNIVAAMILDYRAFDTFGESAVLFTAAMSVMMLLMSGAHQESDDRPTPFGRGDAVLRATAALAVPFILMLGCVIVVSGHLGAGGGFSGGAVLSSALILCANAFGRQRVHSFFTARTFLLLTCSALLVYALAKGYAFFTGANHIRSGIPTGTPGNILSAGLILPLNLCVGVIVSGTLYSFYAIFSEGDI